MLDGCFCFKLRLLSDAFRPQTMFPVKDVLDLVAGVLSMETGSSEEARLARRGSAFLLSRVLQGAGGDVLQVNRLSHGGLASTWNSVSCSEQRFLGCSIFSP